MSAIKGSFVEALQAKHAYTISPFNVQKDQTGINRDFMQEFSFQFKRNDSHKTFKECE